MTPAEARNKYKKPYGLDVWGLWLLLVVGIIAFGVYASRHYALATVPLFITLTMAFGLSLAFVAEIEMISRWFVNGRLKIFCNHCNKFLKPDMPWNCGYCDQENREGFLGHVFLDACKWCGRAPHSIVCPHCGEQCFMDDEKITENPARASHPTTVKDESPKTTPDQARAMEIAELEHRKKKTELEAELIQKEIDVKRLAQAKESLSEKPLRDRLEESLKTYRDRNMGVEEIYRREVERAEKECSSNPDELDRYKLMLTSWRDEHIQ